VDFGGAKARFLRIQHPGTEYLHLDEVEIYAAGDPKKNIAFGRPCDQSSVSQWSAASGKPAARPAAKPVALPIQDRSLQVLLERGRKLAADLGEAGADVSAHVRVLDQVAAQARGTNKLSAEKLAELYRKARWAVRRMALSNPVLDFERLLLVKRAPTSYSHMSDQYYGWWSRTGPGAGMYVLEGWRLDAPRLRCLTDKLFAHAGTFLRPDISHDGKRVLFAYARYYPHVSRIGNKVKKKDIPEDAFFNLYEMALDGTGLRRLTRGRYDDFDGRYLPNGQIVFLSTRRGTFVQANKASARLTLANDAMPDSYVRCGGGNSRPVAIYTLHAMGPDGKGLKMISGFENFEWTPSVAADGRILYARWDYIDRHNNAFMSLWSTNPDGTNGNLVYGNYTRSPQCVFEARSIPGSSKILFTGSAHHSLTGGGLALLDPDVQTEGEQPIVRLTPEVRFPETEGWPATWYANPFPLSEKYYLTAWSAVPLRSQGSRNRLNALGVYLYDAMGNLELIFRDKDLSVMYPLPIRPRKKPPVVSDQVAWEGPQAGKFILTDVYQGLGGIRRGQVKALRVIGLPMKVQPQMNSPSLGITREDPGKIVLGTVPVEADGSAYFHAPSGLSVFFQALDARGMAIQTMRTSTYVQPGQTLSCIGCHEPRRSAPANTRTLASLRPPSKLAVGPEGSWPMRFDRLVQPVLDRHCVKCHNPKGPKPKARRINLTGAKAYQTLIAYGKPSLRDYVSRLEPRPLSPVGHGPALDTPLLSHLRGGKGHQDVKLDADSLERLITWMDTYAQRLGSFSQDQERSLVAFRTRMAGMLVERK